MRPKALALKYRRLILFITLGGLLGFGYYYFIGCATGSCPLQSNPYFMTFYGIVLGGIFGLPGKSKTRKSENKATEELS